MDLKQPGFASSACGSFNKNKELRSLYRLEIQVLFKEMNLIKLVFNMICLMVSQKNQQKELNQTKFCEIKHLKLQVIQIMMDIKEDQPQWFASFLIKNQDEVMLLTSQINNLQMNFIGRLLENSREEKFIHLLETIFGALIYLICNH